MDKVLITPIASSGIAPFEVEGKLESKRFDDDGLIYYIGGHSFCADIVTILHRETEAERKEALKMNVENFNENLKSIVEQRKLTPTRLSHMSGLTISTITNYLYDYCYPILDSAIKIANALEVSLDEMCKKR